jgi:hypothetical protein
MGAFFYARFALAEDKSKTRIDLMLNLEGGMAHWTASAATILLASFSGVASAQPNCDAIPPGPERTDCYLTLSQLYRAQSDLAAAKARAQSDAAWYGQ